MIHGSRSKLLLLTPCSAHVAAQVQLVVAEYLLTSSPRRVAYSCRIAKGVLLCVLGLALKVSTRCLQRGKASRKDSGSGIGSGGSIIGGGELSTDKVSSTGTTLRDGNVRTAFRAAAVAAFLSV